MGSWVQFAALRPFQPHAVSLRCTRPGDHGFIKMANYYPLIAGVVDALENSSAELRRRLYESARAGFLEQMRKHDPPLDESYIRKEQTALEEAIRKVEAEQMNRARG